MKLKHKIPIIVLILIIFAALSGSAVITKSSPIETIIVDEDTGVSVNIEDDGAMSVHVEDQYTEIIDLHLREILSEINLTLNTSIDDTEVQISSSILPVIGNTICLQENTAFFQAELLSVVAIGGTIYNVTLDTPLDFAFTTLGGCTIGNKDLSVDGSVTPVIFRLSPKNLVNGTSWDITRIFIHITDDAAMDDGRFGGIPKLTKGIFFRSKNGITKNIFNAKDNGDLLEHTYDLTYSDKAPSGEFGLTTRRTFGGPSKNGVTIRLDADTDDEIQMIVQDDLTDILHMHVVAQGHVVS